MLLYSRSAVRVLTNRQTDGRYQVHYLPRFAVDKNGVKSYKSDQFFATSSYSILGDETLKGNCKDTMLFETSLDGVDLHSHEKKSYSGATLLLNFMLLPKV